ncbi:hypothetical protein J3E69DRAFT_361207 [Trichoderma sp. SZMC 28015]
MGYTGRLKDPRKRDNKGKNFDSSYDQNPRTQREYHSIADNEVSIVPRVFWAGAGQPGYVGENVVERGMAAQVLERWIHRAWCDRYNKNEGLWTAHPPFETEIDINPVAFLSDDDLASTTRQVHTTRDFEVFGGPNVGDIEAKEIAGLQWHLFSGERRWDAAPLQANSAKSLDDSDSFATNESTLATSPDIATGEHTPSPKPNHLSGYFKYSTKPAALVEPEPAPMIPQRSPTHTKSNSVDAVARSQSISRISRDSDLSAASRSLQAFSRTPSVSAFEAFVFFGRKIDDLFCGASFLRTSELVIM